MRTRNDENTAEISIPIDDLRGRAVWSEAGERIGSISSVKLAEDGSIDAFEVRERWILGPHHKVSAGGLRLDDGDVVVPSATVDEMRAREARSHLDALVARPRAGTTARAERAHGVASNSRMGGLSLVGGLVGALTMIASALVVGGLLIAIFNSTPAVIDSSLASFEAITTEPLLLGAVTLFVAGLVGGLAAGRSSRVRGVLNGSMAAGLLVAMVAVFAALGEWVASRYDVLAATQLPSVELSSAEPWGIGAVIVAALLLLSGAMIGGPLGVLWHRRIDRAMLEPADVARVGERTSPADPLERSTSPETSSIKVRNLDE